MAIQGGIIETKEIGIPMSLNGEYNNTELVNDKIRLKLKSGSQTEYEKFGYWISEVIDIGDEFKDFENFISKVDVSGNSQVVISTRTSSDGIAFNNWSYLGNANEITSDKNRYVQVRFEFTAGTSDNLINIPTKNSTDLIKFNNSELLAIDNGLKIRDSFELAMTIDTNWTSDGTLYRKNLTANDWLRFNTINTKDGV